jgi:hypothetical protein
VPHRYSCAAHGDDRAAASSAHHRPAYLHPGAADRYHGAPSSPAHHRAAYGHADRAAVHLPHGDQHPSPASAPASYADATNGDPDHGAASPTPHADPTDADPAAHGDHGAGVRGMHSGVLEATAPR